MVSVQLMYQAIMVHTCTTQHSVHHTQLFYSHMVSVGQMFQPILVCLHHTASSISSQLSFCAPIPYTHKSAHTYIHACPPQNCIFRNKNHQNPEHSIFSGTHHQTYHHIYEINPATRSYRKVTGQSTLCSSLTHSVQLRTLVCQSRLTICQFNHFTTVLQTTEFTKVSPFLSMVTKGHFSWYTFLTHI